MIPPVDGPNLILFLVYCIQMESNPDSWYPFISPPCGLKGHFNASTHADVRGGQISLNHNGVTKAIVPAGFEKFKYCFEPEDVDLENDEFQLELLADDGVYDPVSEKSFG